MSLAEQLEAMVVDHLYQDVIKPRVTKMNTELDGLVPYREGYLRAATWCFLTMDSDDDKAIVMLRSNPPQTAPYNTWKIEFGNNADLANFSNHRGSSKGWWEDAVKRFQRVILE